MFRSKGNLAKQIGWYVLAFCIITCIVNSINCVWVAVALSLIHISGAQSYGLYAYMKHFALNDQQTNQSKLLCTWADEQAIREIYLRPFEISAKVGGCKAVPLPGATIAILSTWPRWRASHRR